MMPSPSSVRRRRWRGGGHQKGGGEDGEALRVGGRSRGAAWGVAPALDLTGSTTPTPGAMAVIPGRRRRCSGGWQLRLNEGGTDWRAGRHDVRTGGDGEGRWSATRRKGRCGMSRGSQGDREEGQSWYTTTSVRRELRFLAAAPCRISEILKRKQHRSQRTI
jgi:hypothetical protein